MAIENFKKFKQKISTKIDYGCEDDKKFYLEDSDVMLFAWNKYEDIKKNPTSELEEFFLNRGAIVEFEGMYVYLAKIKRNGKWEDCLLTELEVVHGVTDTYLEFRIVKEIRKEVYFDVKMDGNKIIEGTKPIKTREVPYVTGIEFINYNCEEKPYYGDFIIFSKEDLRNGEKQAIENAIYKELEFCTAPHIKIGRPPKEELK